VWSLRGQAGHRAASQTQLSNPGAGLHARLCPLVRTPAWRSAAPAFQGSLTSVPQMFPERGLRFAFALQPPAVERTEPNQAGPFAGGKARKACARSTRYDISSDQATIAVRLRSVHLQGAPRAAADQAFKRVEEIFSRYPITQAWVPRSRQSHACVRLKKIGG